MRRSVVSDAMALGLGRTVHAATPTVLAACVDGAPVAGPVRPTPPVPTLARRGLLGACLIRAFGACATLRHKKVGGDIGLD